MSEDGQASDALVIGPPANLITGVIKAIRPRQWMKNVLVLAAPLSAAGRGHRYDYGQLGIQVSVAFVVFSLAASAVYLINDVRDVEADREHPTKRFRPIAAGIVPEWLAYALAVVLAAASLGLAWWLTPNLTVVMAVYIAMQLGYCFGLKHQAVTDVFCIASGFMLRILAGTWGIRIAPSGWLLLTGMFITLFLGFAKRRAEWADGPGTTLRRPVLDVYSPELLDTFLSITGTGAVLSYGLYTLDAKTIALHHTDKLIYTLPFVLFGLFRYLFLLHRHKKGENPSADVFTDHQIIICALAYAGTALWLLNR